MTKREPVNEGLRILLRLAALVVFCVAASITRVGAATPPAFPLDALLGAPYPDLLTAALDGRALVWTVHERGARNLTVWKDGVTKQVTHETADDGQDLSSPQLTPGANAVVYARGGSDQSDSGDGLNPNPLSLAVPPARRILITSLPSGTTTEIGEGIRPVLSPRGDRVAWEARDGIAIATVRTPDGGRTWVAGKPETPFAVRGAVHGIVWSPDGTRLAATDAFGDHAWIVVYALGAKDVVYASPAFAQDGDPAWSPDGTRIAFVRRPGPTFASNEIYDGPPAAGWSLVVADARSGAGHAVFTADRSVMGHAFVTNADGPPLAWSGDGATIAFPWEKTGWLHVFAIAANGGTPRDLTPGAFEIEQTARTVDGRNLLYTSNQGDLDRRHLWRVAFAGGAPQQLTAGEGSQWAPAGLADGFAFIEGGWRDAPFVVRRTASGAAQPLTAAAPAPEYPAAALVQPRLVTFRAADGVTIHGQLFVPRDDRATHAAVIFTHGGPPRQMLPGFHYMEPYAKLYELNQAFANRGIVVLSINYRSGIMYGHAFREAPRRGWLGASEYQDVLAGAAFLRARRDVDPRRIGLYGLSYGGYLTALALARNSDIFAAGADQAGVHDWRALVDFWNGRPVGTERQRRIAFEASPDASIDAWRSPVYVSQGDDDRNVPFDQSVDLVTRLHGRGVDVTESAVPNELHAYNRYDNELRRFQETLDFLVARLAAPRDQGVAKPRK